MTRWTEEQQRVISHREGNLLVSAAAGSGKTAVLVEHVIDRILDRNAPIRLSSLVLMTFTEAAAREMKERIHQRLLDAYQESGDARIEKELLSLPNANISTIDAFCKRLIQENYTELGIEPNFRIAEKNELQLLEEEILEEILEEEYSVGTERFLAFVDRYSGGKEDRGVQELLLRIYHLSMSNPFPENYLQSLSKEKEEAWKLYLLTYFSKRLEDVLSILRTILSLCDETDGPSAYRERIEEDYENFLSLKKELENGEREEALRGFLQAVQKVNFGRLKSSKAAGADEAKKKRNQVKAILADWKKSFLFLPKELEEKVEREGRESIEEAIRLTLLFMERFHEEKRERNILDFQDLEHFALRLLYREKEGQLCFTALADELAKEYAEILVDEYQDSNLVQEYLVNALSAERFGRADVFQVGDVKQSIYRFRLARPELFLQKYNDATYPKIFLQKNFRSLKGVITIVNYCFHRLMKREIGGILYDKENSLFQGRTGEEEKESKAELLLVETEEREEALRLECCMIAKRVKELKEIGIEYKDMVVLLRSPKKQAKEMVELFTSEGIPSYAVSSAGYYQQVEIETVLAFLSLIDNPLQDIPLAAVLRSAMFGFTDEELALLSISYGSLVLALSSAGSTVQNEEDITKAEERSVEGAHKISADLQKKWQSFVEKLTRYRKLSRNLRVHELLYLIYEETAYYLYVQTLPGGEKRKANLDQLIEDALQFEKGSFSGLFYFIRYIEKTKQKEYDEGEASIYSEEDNLLRIMSIHQSKGLQFKVVFLSSLQRQFNKKDMRNAVLLDEKLGIASDYLDLENRIRYPSLQLAAMKEKLEEESLGEELRLLYVAMTRAEEKLILTASGKKADSYQEKYADLEELSLEDIRKASSYLDWILMACGKVLYSSAENPILSFHVYSKEDLEEKKEEERREGLSLEKELYSFLERRGEPSIEEEEWDKDFSFCYPYEESTHLYPKYTVSAVKRLEEEKRKTEEESVSRFISVENEEENSLKGRKEKGLGARIGDSFHHALAIFDYTKGLEQLPAILEEEERNLLNKEQFQTFLSSSLGECFKKAFQEKRLFREMHFMRALPFRALFPDRKEEDEVLLQGIIDAFIVEDDGIILVDYKTDRVKSEEELRERYRKQIMLYSDALEAILGKRVKRRVLYSFYLGEEVEILP